ncbi:MAG: Crp/Fnr family transcriptional regulator, partial [Treponema sp.]|nr:Crp/Fnr family transcriptional regulator [Treponema sp.]
MLFFRKIVSSACFRAREVLLYAKSYVLQGRFNNFFAGDKDDRIFILQNGKVELSAVDIVSELEIKEQVKQGDFFGVKNALIKEQRTDTARAVTDCQVIALTPQEFEKSFSANREVMLKMLTSFNRSLRSLHYSTET